VLTRGHVPRNPAVVQLWRVTESPERIFSQATEAYITNSAVDIVFALAVGRSDL